MTVIIVLTGDFHNFHCTKEFIDSICLEGDCRELERYADGKVDFPANNLKGIINILPVKVDSSCNCECLLDRISGLMLLKAFMVTLFAGRELRQLVEYGLLKGIAVFAYSMHFMSSMNRDFWYHLH